MRSVSGSILLLVVLLLGSVNAWSAVGRILIFEGDVRVNGEQVNAETVLNQDDTVATGADGAVTIVLADNSVLDLENDSDIEINDYYYNAAAPQGNTRQIGVLAGTLRYVSGKIAKDDPTELAKKLVEIHNDPDRAEQLCQQGQTDAYDFRTLRSIEKIEDELHHMLEAARQK